MHADLVRSRCRLGLLAAAVALLVAVGLRLSPGAVFAAACPAQHGAACEQLGRSQPDALVAGNPNLVITSPTPGSKLTNISVSFTWNSVSGTSAYVLYVGTTLGGRELGSYYPGTSTSTTVNVLPAQAGTVYVRLWADVSGTWEENDFLYTTSNTLAVTSPTPGSAFTSSSVNFSWTSVTGATLYVLYIGTSVDTMNLNSDFTTGTSTTSPLTVLAPAAGPVYVRLWVELPGSIWLSNDFLYTTNQVLAPSSPTPGSALSSTLVPFSWNSVTGSSNYSLYVGTSLGGSDLYEGFTTGTSLTATVLPPRTGIVYVRLWADVSSTWMSTDFTYTTAYSLAVSSPAPGSTLSSSSPTFSWNSVSGTTEYVLWVGSAPNQYDLFWGTNGTTTSEATSGLPTNGSTLYVEVWAEISSTWEGTQFTYTASGTGASGLATLSSPTPGSTLSSLSAVTFSWTAGTSVTAYMLSAGSAVGRQDYYQSGSLSTTSVSATSLPNDASTVYVELASKISGTWYTNSYTYTASGVPTGVATLTSPTPGSTFTSTSASFSWTTGSGVTAYQLIVGALIGECDYLCSGSVTTTSATVTGLPSDGSTVYASLMSEVGGIWYTTNYAFTGLNTGPSGPAPGSVTLLSPANNATGTGTTPTLSWAAPTGSTPGQTTYTVAIWDPYVEPSGSQLAAISAGTSLSVAVPSGEGLAAGTDYEWNVSACNGTACSGYGTCTGSVTWCLFTTSASSGTVSQSSPTTGATGESLTPPLTWGSVSGTTAYIVSIWDPYAVPAGHLMGDITVTSGTSVTVPASEGLSFSQWYYWNVRSCTGTSSPYTPCGPYNTTWFSFQTAAMATLAPGGTTYTPSLSAIFAGGVTPTGWSYSTGPGTYQATYTSSTINLDPGGTNTLGLSYGLSYTATPWTDCGGMFGCTSGTEDDGNSVAVYATPSGGSATLIYCDELLDPDICSSGPDVSTATIPLSSSLGTTVTISIVLDWYRGYYGLGPTPTLNALAQLDGAGMATGPQTGVSAAGSFPKPVSSAAGGVNVTTGIFGLSQTDMTLGGAWPLGFTRSYTSVGAALRYVEPGAWPLGPGWSTNWQAAVTTDSYGDAYVQVPAGSFLFLKSGANFYAQAGVVGTLTYASGTYTLTTADQTQWVISGSYLISVTDRFGKGYALSYTAGMLASITSSSGRVITVSSSGGLITGLSDGTGRSVSYTYSGGLLSTVTDVNGKVWTYSYNSNDQLTGVQDQSSPGGGYTNGDLPVRLWYDTQGRVATFKDGTDATLSYSYGSPAAGATTVTDQNGNPWVFYYLPSLEQIGEKDPYGLVLAQSYDVDKNTTLVSNAVGQATSATYDSTTSACPGVSSIGMGGNVCAVVDPLGYEVTKTYDSKNDVLTVTDQDGHTTTNTYNTAGGLTSVQDALGHTTTYSLASTGLVNSVTDANSNTTTYTYNTTSGSIGDKLAVTDALSHTTSYTYDSVGRPLTVTTPSVYDAGTGTSVTHTTSTTYDNAGNVLTVTVPVNLSGHSTAVTTSTFDVYGRALTVQDPNGNTTDYTYDPRGLLLSVQDPVNGLSHLTTYAYDAAGNRQTVTDANGHAWTYTYDEDNRPLTVTDPNSHTTLSNSYATTTTGRLSSSTDGKSQATSLSYDARGTLVTTTYAGSTGSVGYTFDGAGNRLSLADSTGMTTYSYDADNRLTGVTFPDSRSVSYGYDNVGNRTSLTYPSGSSVAYTYDADERLASVADWNSKTTSYTYDAAARLSTVTLPAVSGGNHVVGTYQYFGNNALATVNWVQGSTTLASATYTIDQDSNRTSRTTTFASGGSAQTEGYCYDGLNRLVSVYGTTTPSCGSGSPTQSYTFDRVGNRTALATSAGTTSYSFDSADQLNTVTPPSPASAISYSYDANGSVITRGSDSFTWDGANRLTADSVAGGDAQSLTYNGDGLRQSRTDSTTGVTTNFVWDLASSTIIDDGSQYVYGAAGLVEQVQSGTPYYFLQDGLGSTMAVVDGTGTIQQTESYDVYGKATAGTSSHPTEYQFAGQETDSSGLQYLRARYYDPGTGRFLSRDPISLADPTGHHPYSYGDDDPPAASDPGGLDTLLQNPCICGRTDGTYAYTEDEAQYGGSNQIFAAAVDDPTPANVAAAAAAGAAPSGTVQMAALATDCGQSSTCVEQSGGSPDGNFTYQLYVFDNGKGSGFWALFVTVSASAGSTTIDETSENFTDNWVTYIFFNLYWYNETTSTTGHEPEVQYNSSSPSGSKVPGSLSNVIGQTNDVSLSNYFHPGLGSVSIQFTLFIQSYKNGDWSTNGNLSITLR